MDVIAITAALGVFVVASPAFFIFGRKHGRRTERERQAAAKATAEETSKRILGDAEREVREPSQERRRRRQGRADQAPRELRGRGPRTSRRGRARRATHLRARERARPQVRAPRAARQGARQPRERLRSARKDRRRPRAGARPARRRRTPPPRADGRHVRAGRQGRADSPHGGGSAGGRGQPDPRDSRDRRSETPSAKGRRSSRWRFSASRRITRRRPRSRPSRFRTTR